MKTTQASLLWYPRQLTTHVNITVLIAEGNGSESGLTVRPKLTTWPRDVLHKACQVSSLTFQNLYFSMCKIRIITVCVCVCQSLSHVLLFATPWTVALQARLSLEVSRQEYWSGLPFPSPGDLPEPGIELALPVLQADFYPLSHRGSPIYPCCYEFSKNHENHYFPSINNLNIHIIVLLFCNIFSRPTNYF